MPGAERNAPAQEQSRLQQGGWPQAGRETLARWWSGQGALPTTLAGVELSLVAIFLLIRLTDVVQLSIATREGLLRSTRPALDAAIMVFYLAESVVVATVLIKARRYYSARWATVDLITAVFILLAQPLFTSPADRVGTWVAWGFAVSIGVSVGVGIGFPQRWQTAAGVAALSVSYLVVSLPAGAPAGSAATVWSNAFGYIGFGVFGRAAGGYLRRLGRDADTARQHAAEAAAEAMLNRQRHLLHDQAGVLRQLAHPETDPVVADLLRARAATAAVQIRQWLATTPTVDLHGQHPDRRRSTRRHRRRRSPHHRFARPRRRRLTCTQIGRGAAKRRYNSAGQHSRTRTRHRRMACPGGCPTNGVTGRTGGVAAGKVV